MILHGFFYSGASYHMTNDVSKLHNCHTPASSITIHTADATPLPVSLIGSVSNKLLSFTNVLCVPHLSISLISVSKLTSSGFLISFSSTGCSVQDPRTGRQIGTGLRSGGLYYLQSLHLPPSSFSPVAHVSSASPFALWHSRLGHLSLNKMKLLFNSGVLGNIYVSNISTCFGCHFGKQHAFPYNKSTSFTTAPLLWYILMFGDPPLSQ